MTGRVAYVVRSWPRLSQTFVLNEVLAVERLGCELSIFAMVRSGEELVQPQLAQVRAPVHYLDDDPDPSGGGPRRRAVLGRARAWATAHGRRSLGAGYATVSPSTSLRLGTRLADAIDRSAADGRPIDHIHAHFAHDPALVAMFAHQLTGLPFSFTAHARDLYGIPRSALVARARSASAIITCCQANVDYLHSQLPARLRSRVRLIHHGVDLSAFAPLGATVAAAPAAPLIVSVGRLVEKKGFTDLLDALGLLRSRGVRFRCVIYGDGPFREALEHQRRALGLDDMVELAGQRRQDEVAAELDARPGVRPDLVRHGRRRPRRRAQRAGRGDGQRAGRGGDAGGRDRGFSYVTATTACWPRRTTRARSPKPSETCWPTRSCASGSAPQLAAPSRRTSISRRRPAA